MNSVENYLDWNLCDLLTYGEQMVALKESRGNNYTNSDPRTDARLQVFVHVAKNLLVPKNKGGKKAKRKVI